MAGIGIILLLFEVGLETDVKRLARTGVESVVVALAGFILPLLFGFGLAYWLFDLPLLVSLFIGGTLTATSIGITVRVLGGLKRQHSKEGQVVLGGSGGAGRRDEGGAVGADRCSQVRDEPCYSCLMIAIGSLVKQYTISSMHS